MDGTLHRLVERAADGDREAFSRLVEAEWHRLVRLARSVVGEADAEDAVQDGLIRAWRKLPGLRRPEAFPSWVARVVARGCFRRHRRRPALLALADAPESQLPTAPGRGPEHGLDVERLLGLLAPRQRAVMHLTVVEGMSDREIGELLDIAAGSVRAHRRRAREALQRVLAPAGSAGSADGTGRGTPSSRTADRNRQEVAP